MDIRLALMCGIDIPIPEIQLTLHQPTIKEISCIGEEAFFVALQCLELNKSMFIEDNSLLGTTTNFQIFMTIMQEQDTKDKKESVILLLQLLFPNYKVTITPNSIICIGEGNSLIIDENNFEILQDYIKQIFCFKNTSDQSSFNPANKKAQEIAKKLMRGRQRVAEQKGSNNISIFSQYLSVLTIGLKSMSLQDVMDLTVYQVYDLIERYLLYMNWDIDIRSRIAGAKPDSKPDNWMKNIH